MATKAVVDIGRLDEGWILAPERYDPRRRTNEAGSRLGDFVNVMREQVHGRTVDGRRFLVLDTGDAQDGIIRTTKRPCSGAAIRSTKKRIRPKQVIISRLRPYLRQIAWVDPGLLKAQECPVVLLCSTEFFVLESVDGSSIAFLAPYLLSPSVQSILAAAQEGGHHPRFNERTLTTLPIPVALVERRDELSAQLERAVNQARDAYGMVRDGIRIVSGASFVTS